MTLGVLELAVLAATKVAEWNGPLLDDLVADWTEDGSFEVSSVESKDGRGRHLYITSAVGPGDVEDWPYPVLAPAVLFNRPAVERGPSDGGPPSPSEGRAGRPDACPHCGATDAVPLAAGLGCTNPWHHSGRTVQLPNGRTVQLPNQADVDALRDLLDLMADWPGNDQRARFILTSNWLRDRDIRIASSVSSCPPAGGPPSPAEGSSGRTSHACREGVCCLCGGAGPDVAACSWDDEEHGFDSKACLATFVRDRLLSSPSQLAGSVAGNGRAAACAVRGSRRHPATTLAEQGGS